MNKVFAVVACMYCSLTLAVAPVKLQVSPGQQQPVTLSRLHLNRIITPFAAPQIRTKRTAAICLTPVLCKISGADGHQSGFLVYSYI